MEKNSFLTYLHIHYVLWFVDDNNNVSILYQCRINNVLNAGCTGMERGLVRCKAASNIRKRIVGGQ